MIIRKISVGPLQANCYIVADEETKEAVIIDPGDEPGKIIELINENGFKPKLIILTHSHFDHTGAVEGLKKEFFIDSPVFKSGDEAEIGKTKLKVVETPGHTPDSICVVGPDVIFTGDTLFKDSIGRTDLPGGDMGQMQESLKRLTEFPDNSRVYPGHGPESTIGEEKQSNPFLQQL